MRDLFRPTRSVVVLAFAMLAIGVGEAREPQAGAATTKVDLERLGPKIGTRLPGFTLRDQHGAPHALESLLGPKGALIVFFRSADW